jgi:hypothetical protein
MYTVLYSTVVPFIFEPCGAIGGSDRPNLMNPGGELSAGVGGRTRKSFIDLQISNRELPLANFIAFGTRLRVVTLPCTPSSDLLLPQTSVGGSLGLYRGEW